MLFRSKINCHFQLVMDLMMPQVPNPMEIDDAAIAFEEFLESNGCPAIPDHQLDNFLRDDDPPSLFFDEFALLDLGPIAAAADPVMPVAAADPVVPAVAVSPVMEKMDEELIPEPPVVMPIPVLSPGRSFGIQPGVSSFSSHRPSRANGPGVAPNTSGHRGGSGARGFVPRAVHRPLVRRPVTAYGPGNFCRRTDVFRVRTSDGRTLPKCFKCFKVGHVAKYCYKISSNSIF